MSEIHNTNASPATPAPENWFIDALKKQSVAIIIFLAGGFYVFVWNSHDNSRDTKYQTDANTKAIERLIAADKEQTDTLNQFLIGMTKMSEAVNRLAQDVQKIQDQQQKNTEILLNRK